MGIEAKSIKKSIDEQKRAVEEISRVISEWNQKAFITASSSEEMSTTSVILSSNADLLNGIVAQFQF
ncbi:hypothetical protein [Leptospira limi]|uniref:Uncharacterized protein n=1 Tax=Leptospira limi TaxID=2950023 RepID=A0ABT3LWS2_9LEPT|nr:hypothetical protein [Leptospira limi]MCW7462143.1 hypothetical protein [Leptospira limi]